MLGAEFADLTDRLHEGRPVDLDDYGATNPAEFFAGVTEAFFESPALLHGKHPDLYAELAAFYKQDPMARRPAEAETRADPSR